MISNTSSNDIGNNNSLPSSTSNSNLSSMSSSADGAGGAKQTHQQMVQHQMYPTDSRGLGQEEKRLSHHHDIRYSEEAEEAGRKETGGHDAFVRKLSLIASLSGLLFGYDTGVVSGAIIFIRSDMDLSDFQVEIVVASTVLSAAFSALGGGTLLDTIGRKKTLVIASMIFVFGSILMALSFGPPKHGYGMLIIGRLIVGVAIGLAADAGPLYISECAPPKMRGSLTTLFNMAVVGGQVLASFVCGCLSYLPPSYNWRLMLGFGALPAIAQMIGFIVLPYSPTWLVLAGRKDEAEDVLRKIRMIPKVVHCHNSEITDDEGYGEKEYLEDEVTRELKDIIEEHEKAKKGQHVTLLELWKFYPQVRRSMILGCSLWIVSQLAGKSEYVNR